MGTFAWCVLAWSSVAGAKPSVVFLGNSYTQRNDLGNMVERMLDGVAADSFDPESTVLASGGFTLEDHAVSVGTRSNYQEVFAGTHRWVVLQDQSQVPGFPADQAAWRLSQRSAQELHEQAALTGADSVLFVTWGRRDGDTLNTALYPDFSTMQDLLDAGYLAYADAMREADGQDVWMAPVGSAFRSLHDEVAAVGDPLASNSPFVALYASDGSHPSEEGTYLAASVITASLTGRLPRADLPSLSEPVERLLQRHAEQTVLHDPFGDWSYPWAHTWEAWQALGDVDPISDPLMTPTVLVDEPVSRASWVLGSTHEDGPGEGRLFVDDGGTLTVIDVLTLGAEGHGELVVQGGDAQVSRVVMGQTATGTGAAIVRGGLLRVGEVEVGDGVGVMRLEGGMLEVPGDIGAEVRHQSGELVYWSDTRLAGYRLVGGTLGLSVDTPLTVVGDVVLAGTLDVTATPEDAGEVLLYGATIDVSQAVLGAAPEGGGFEVTDEADGQALRFTWDEVVVDTDDDTDVPEEPVPTPEDTDQEPPVSVGCGCRLTGAGAGWWVLLGLGLGVVRRRRRQ
jgi:MYXO-CTERM domain-containing protein